MNKTLLLVFIHGFKGGELTFGENAAFTEHVRSLVARELPKLNVQAIVYPKYETRGDLGECASRFRDWLLSKVIDLEVSAGTPSPTIDPSVRTILIGHSMGGIVAAEAAIALATEQPIHGTTDPRNDDDNANKPTATPAPTLNGLMFPYVQGVLAFDTPFLGISPGVVAHGAEGHYNAATAAMSQLTGLTSLWGANAKTKVKETRQKGLPGPAPVQQDEKKASTAATTTRTPANSWSRWGKMAMVAGAVVAAGSAAYYNREEITQGWTWAASHLEFVGCLARKEELRRRVATMARLSRESGVGFGNLYTRLGKGTRKAAGGQNVAGTVFGGGPRTFCVVPTGGNGKDKDVVGDWREAVNEVAEDETAAHMTMFEPKHNPNYEALASDAAGMIASWSKNDWYETSTKDTVEI